MRSSESLGVRFVLAQAPTAGHTRHIYTDTDTHIEIHTETYTYTHTHTQIHTQTHTEKVIHTDTETDI